MSKKKAREGYKFSKGHEVRIGHRWDEKLEKEVKETRGKKAGGPTARSLSISFGASQLDLEAVDRECERLDEDRSALLYTFFQDGMARLKNGKATAKSSSAPVRPVVLLVSVNHLDDLDIAQEGWKLGAVMIVPALNTAQLRLALPNDLFDDAIASYVRGADAVLFGKGVSKSKQASAVKSTAQSNGKPVFQSFAQLTKWMKASKRAA